MFARNEATRNPKPKPQNLMLHPDKSIQKKQRDFLLQCPESEREYHARMFRIGNATIIYHQLAASNNDTTLEIYYREWLAGLPPALMQHMQQQGFEACKSMLPFTRFVNERKDYGLDDWLKQHLSEDDYNSYKSSSIP